MTNNSKSNKHTNFIFRKIPISLDNPKAINPIITPTNPVRPVKKIPTKISIPIRIFNKEIF